MEVLMKHNIGRCERVLRVLFGSFFVLNGWGMLEGYGPGVGSAASLIVGAALIITGIFSYCPLNVLFHHNSCKHCRQGITEEHLPI